MLILLLQPAIIWSCEAYCRKVYLIKFSGRDPGARLSDMNMTGV